MTQKYVHLNSRQQPYLTSTPTRDLTPTGPHPHYFMEKFSKTTSLNFRKIISSAVRHIWKYKRGFTEDNIGTNYNR